MAPDQSLAIGVGRLEMKPNVPIDLDGAIKGGIIQAVKKGGDEDPKFEIEVTKVSGLEGRKTTYVGSAPFLHRIRRGPRRAGRLPDPDLLRAGPRRGCPAHPQEHQDRARAVSGMAVSAFRDGRHLTGPEASGTV